LKQALDAAKEAAEQRRMIMEKRQEIRRLAKAFQSTTGAKETSKRRQNQSNHWKILQSRTLVNKHRDSHQGEQDPSEALDLGDAGGSGSGAGVEKVKGSTFASKVKAMNLVFGLRRTVSKRTSTRK
jgi:hypothetical protein